MKKASYFLYILLAVNYSSIKSLRINYTVITMILSVPYQAIEIGNIILNDFQYDNKGRNIIPITYKDNSIEMNDLSILTPPLKIIDYDSQSCRLRLDISPDSVDQFVVKLLSVQEYIISTVYLYKMPCIEFGVTRDVIDNMFQPLINGNVLSVYLFPSTVVKTSDNSTKIIGSIKPGSMIRFVIRISGISYLLPQKKLRLQHSIPSVWSV
jgi:hypothetical protein